MAQYRNAIVIVALTAFALACGEADDDDTGSTSTAPSGVPPVALEVAARQTPNADPSTAGHAIAAFGADLFSAARSLTPIPGNVTVSPASVAVALAMVEPGAVGDAQAQLRALLRIDDPQAFHASMNALERNLEARVPEPFNEGDDPGEITARIANAAYLQQGYPFRADYLEAVGTNYGPVLHEVDFMSDPDAVAHEINTFVADATNERITDLVGDGVIKPETVLALVNALYLKASWLQTFEHGDTVDDTFTNLEGDALSVPMMHGHSDSSARGDGWIGATKQYVGGLSAQFILPDDGRFDDIAANLPDVFAEYDANRTSGAELAMPRFETRFNTELSAALGKLGLTGPFVEGGLLGIADDPRLVIDQVIHETFVAMDEEGTEAAAATVVLMFPTSGPLLPPVPVTLDRPFLYRIIDDQTGAVLFIGQIVDPTE